MYKSLTSDLRGLYGYGDYTEYMPRGKRPGKWLPPVDPVLCKSGYHGCETLADLLFHLGERIVDCEARGTVDRGGDKVACEQIRIVSEHTTWNPETQRLFAVDCARIVVGRYAAVNDRPLLHACLDVCVASGLYGKEWDTARNAAWDAAWNAAGNAAWNAADAARNAAWNAAAFAARNAAWNAARDEQAALLERYLAGEQGPFVEEE